MIGRRQDYGGFSACIVRGGEIIAAVEKFCCDIPCCLS
jgi:hypothetical protein